MIDTTKILVGKNTWISIPVVALVAGVVNGQFVSKHELEKTVGSWNGRPIVVGHPQVDGNFVSANQPDLLRLEIGKLFGVELQEDKLKGEMWLNETLVEEFGGKDALALELLKKGIHVEVSTGYFCETVPVANGVFNGVAYDMEQVNLKPDHLAILLNEEGACSWNDGCGAPRVNRRNSMGSNAKLVANEGVVLASNPANDPMAEGEGTVEEAVEEQTGQTVPAELAQFAAMLIEIGGVEKLRSMLEELKVLLNPTTLSDEPTADAITDQVKKSAIAEIVGNCDAGFTREELNVLSRDTVLKVLRASRPKDFRLSAGSPEKKLDTEWRPYNIGA